MASAVAMNVFGTVITSSPGPIPSARRVSQSASVPLPTPMAYLGAAIGRELFFKSFHERSARKRATVDYFANGAIELADQGGVMRLQIKKGNFHLRLG